MSDQGKSGNIGIGNTQKINTENKNIDSNQNAGQGTKNISQDPDANINKSKSGKTNINDARNNFKEAS
jgi:hypothetical protein